jgi:hypothetical protein
MKKLTSIFASFASLLMLMGCDRSSSGGADLSRVPEGGVVIDADVPGTRVFYGEHDLGAVPVRLTGSELTDLGLPRTDSERVILESDGWGEGLFLGIEDEVEHKIHFMAPNPELYFVAQTPWGSRTRTSGGSMSMDRNWFKVKLDTRASEIVDVRLKLLGRTENGLSVGVTATNTSEQGFSGHLPELLFQWGSMHTPWRTRSRHEAPLPDEWSRLDPNEERSTVIDLPLSTSSEGFSLFCVMHLFEDPEGNTLAGKGAIYGDSIWVPAELKATKAQSGPGE